MWYSNDRLFVAKSQVSFQRYSATRRATVKAHSIRSVWKSNLWQSPVSDSFQQAHLAERMRWMNHYTPRGKHRGLCDVWKGRSARSGSNVDSCQTESKSCWEELGVNQERQNEKYISLLVAYESLAARIPWYVCVYVCKEGGWDVWAHITVCVYFIFGANTQK